MIISKKLFEKMQRDIATPLAQNLLDLQLTSILQNLEKGI